MFGIDPTVLAIVVLAAVAAAAVSYAVLFSRIESDKKSASRINRVKSAELDRTKVKAARDRVQELSKRRKSMQDSLKDLEKRQHEKTKKTLSLKSRLVQAGLPITPVRFYLFQRALRVCAAGRAFHRRRIDTDHAWRARGRRAWSAALGAGLPRLAPPEQVPR